MDSIKFKQRVAMNEFHHWGFVENSDKEKFTLPLPGICEYDNLAYIGADDKDGVGIYDRDIVMCFYEDVVRLAQVCWHQPDQGFRLVMDSCIIEEMQLDIGDDGEMPDETTMDLYRVLTKKDGVDYGSQRTLSCHICKKKNEWMEWQDNKNHTVTVCQTCKKLVCYGCSTASEIPDWMGKADLYVDCDKCCTEKLTESDIRK